MKKLLTLLMVTLMLVSCGSKSTEDTQTSANLEYAEGTELRVAAGYQKVNEAISFQDAEVTGDGITLADGNTYHTGDLKPTWVHIGEKLNITFTDKFSGAGSADKEFAVWENQLDQIDIVAGGAATLNAAGAEGKLVNLAEHLDQMPNFKRYLEENQIARLSITGNTETGAIYFSPYFDGVDDIERMPLMRTDFVKALLDGSSKYSGANRTVTTGIYEPYNTENYSVESLTSDGSATQTINYDASKNIITQMDAVADLKGDEAVALFRAYIDDQYAGVYDNRSDLFLGYDAAWNADEMVALLRCAVASLNDNDGNPIAGLYSRETSNLQREIDLVRFAGSLFGVRGLESRSDFLYFDYDGTLKDARQEESAFKAVERLNQMVKEGLIITTGEASSTNYLEKDAGLMSYDYNQTQTIMNNTKLQSGEEYIAVMVPVAKWYENAEGVWERFTESWRSVKTDGWAITAAGAGADTNKLNAALTLIDFAFSIQGQITMSYGPDTFIKTKDATVEVKTWDDVAKKYETFNFNGKQMPVVSDECFASCQELTGGNYTNYARRYLGSTLNGFPKSQAFEYQMTSEVGKKGSAVLAAAIAAGVIKHPELAVASNMWYTSVPTVFPTTAEQTNALKGYADLTGNFQQVKDGVCVFFEIVKNGFTVIDGVDGNAAAYADYVKNSWGGMQYLIIKNAQWSTLKTFYESLNK